MNEILTVCPQCQFRLEIPSDFDNVICGGCSTSYWVRRHGGALSLSEIWPEEGDPLSSSRTRAAVEQRLDELDELIEDIGVEVESLKSREQSTPLQMGCAFFGLFTAIIVVCAVFMLLGKGYFGGWLFFISIAAVVLVAVTRFRRKMISPARGKELRDERSVLETDLAKLESERKRIKELKARLISPDQDPANPY